MAEIIDIFAQVDEELEADEVRKYWQKNRDWIVAGTILFFVVLIGYVAWQEVRLRQHQSATNALLQAWDTLEKGEAGRAAAMQHLSTLEQSHGSHGAAVLGRLLHARLLASEGKTADAVNTLEQVVAEAGRTPMADLALLQAAYLVSGEESKVEGYLGRIDTASTFQAQAMELRGLLALKKGDRAGALELFRKTLEIAPKQGALRARLVQRIERLGGSAVPAAGSDVKG